MPSHLGNAISVAFATFGRCMVQGAARFDELPKAHFVKINRHEYLTLEKS